MLTWWDPSLLSAGETGQSQNQWVLGNWAKYITAVDRSLRGTDYCGGQITAVDRLLRWTDWGESHSWYSTSPVSPIIVWPDRWHRSTGDSPSLTYPFSVSRMFAPCGHRTHSGQTGRSGFCSGLNTEMLTIKYHWNILLWKVWKVLWSEFSSLTVWQFLKL